MWRRLPLIVPLLVLGATLALKVLDPAPLVTARNVTFDFMQQMKPRQYEPLPVKVVNIDDESLARFGQWPWPRTLIAQMVDRLTQSGAAVICFTTIFAEPDRTSPKQLLDNFPQAMRKALSETDLPDHDEILARAISNSNVVLGFAVGVGSADAPALKSTYAFAGDNPADFVPNFELSVHDLPILEAAAAGNGILSILPDRDGVTRRLPLMFARDGQLYPSLVAEALRAAQGARTHLVKASGASGVVSFGAHSGVVASKIGAFTVPTDPAGQVWLYDTGPVPERNVPAWKILTGDYEDDAFSGNVVFIAASAAGLRGRQATPLSPTTGAGDIHAQLVEQILTQNFLSRPDWAAGFELLYLFVLGIMVFLAFRIRRGGALLGAIVPGVIVLGGSGFAVYAFLEMHLLLDPVYPAIAGGLVYLSAALLNYMQSESERRQVRTAFGQYLSPALVERLAEHPDQLRLGGEVRQMTFLFCDVRNFTSLSERTGPELLVRILNRFLTRMTDIILGRSGTIDKYMGDAIMAFWNAPLDDPQHPHNALVTALAMRASLPSINEELEAEAKAEGRSWQQLGCGIGVNTGDCLVGNMGSEQRFDYSVIGDAVNLASRLEGQCKTYGVDIILGETTQAAAPEFVTLELDMIRVKGKVEPVRIFALLGDETMGSNPDCTALLASASDLLKCYRAQDWDGAEAALTAGREHQEHFGLAGLLDLYAERIRFFRSNPPGPDWDGVFTAETK
jgi:adenylate cyclase